MNNLLGSTYSEIPLPVAVMALKAITGIIMIYIYIYKLSYRSFNPSYNR